MLAKTCRKCRRPMEWIGRINGLNGSSRVSVWRCSWGHQNVHAYGGPPPYRFRVDAYGGLGCKHRTWQTEFMTLDEARSAANRDRENGWGVRIIRYGPGDKFIAG